MRIVETKSVDGLASLHLVQLREDPQLLIECVDTLEPSIPKNQKWVLMISTQFGCPVGCAICDAGSLSYRGNLTAEEIIAQVRLIVSQNPMLDIRRHPKVKIHFARMGEPSLNRAVLEALKLLAAEFPYLGVIPSLSTVAPDTSLSYAFFEKLIEIKNSSFSKGRFQLQFSIHASDEAARKRLIPIKSWDFNQIARYGERFVGEGDRKVTLNFALGKADRLDGRHLKEIFPTDKFLIKITPINPTTTADRNQATHIWTTAPDSVARSVQNLREMGFDVVVSPSAPEEIEAATSCGQLWSKALREEGEILSKSQTKDRLCYITAETVKEKSATWGKAILPYRRSVFSLNAREAALLVIDMQEFFLNPRSPAYLAASRVILPKVRDLVASFRRLRIPILYTIHAYQDFQAESALMGLWWKNICWDKTPYAKLPPLLAPQEGERVFRKCSYSAFSNPDLEKILRSWEIQELVLVGVMTNLCVESTAREAFGKNFKSFVVSDATATTYEGLHLASLSNLSYGFSTVLSSEELLKGLSL